MPFLPGVVHEASRPRGVVLTANPLDPLGQSLRKYQSGGRKKDADEHKQSAGKTMPPQRVLEPKQESSVISIQSGRDWAAKPDQPEAKCADSHSDQERQEFGSYDFDHFKDMTRQSSYSKALLAAYSTSALLGVWVGL